VNHLGGLQAYPASPATKYKGHSPSIQRDFVARQDVMIGGSREVVMGNDDAVGCAEAGQKWKSCRTFGPHNCSMFAPHDLTVAANSCRRFEAVLKNPPSVASTN
jgi:hypothetical protein